MYSISFFFSGCLYRFFFLVPLLFVLFIINYFKTKNFNKVAFYVLVLICLLHLLVDYNIIYQLYQSVILKNPVFFTHRYDYVERAMQGNAFNVAKFFFLNGTGHEQSMFQEPILFFFFPLSIIFLTKKFICNLKDIKTYLFSILKIIIFPTIIFLLYFFTNLISHTELFANIQNKSIFSYFKIVRISLITIPLWYFFMGVTLSTIQKSLTKQYIIVLLGLMQIFYIVYNNCHIRKSLEDIVSYKFLGKKRSIKNECYYWRRTGFISFKSYFSENLYKKIANYIDKDKSAYKVASLGLDPMIALYNDFHTVDGCFPNQPILYKRRFGKIIEGELNKDEDLKYYFVNGNDTTIFSSEFPVKHYEHLNECSSISFRDLDIDTKGLKNLGCQYIFSAHKIDNANRLNLSLLVVFTDAESPWRIYLYLLK